MINLSTLSDDDLLSLRLLCYDYSYVFTEDERGKRIWDHMRLLFGIEAIGEPTPFQNGRKGAYWEINQFIKLADKIDDIIAARAGGKDE